MQSTADTSLDQTQTQTQIAIIGLAARLPGADTLDDVWRILKERRVS